MKKLLSATRRRLRNIDPLRAGKVLGHERYWTFPFLRLYLEECDECAFHEPEKGYLLAQHAPELARRIPVAPGLESYDGDREKIAWRVRALAVWGSCSRAFGELTQAAAAYERAQELTEGRPPAGGENLDIEPDALGELRARQAVLALTFRDLEAAEKLSSTAVDLFEAGGNGQRKADALVIRGVGYYQARDRRVLDDSLSALDELQRLEAGHERTYVSAMHNIGLALALGGTSPETIQLAGRLVGRVRSRFSKRRLSTVKARAFWVEGMVLFRLALSRIAEKRFLQARESLWQLGDARDYSAVSMDLACLYMLDGEIERARSLLRETGTCLESQVEDPALLELVQRWRGTLTLRDLESLRALHDEAAGLSSSWHPPQPTQRDEGSESSGAGTGFDSDEG